MRPSVFYTCLGLNAISTGNSGVIVSSSDFASGSGSSLIYNLQYSTGSHFSGGIIYGPNLPLISVGTGNISGYNFTGNQSFRYGYTISGNFTVILDLDYDGCSRNTTNVGFTLLTSADSPTGLSGNFLLGINDVNRLYFESPGYTKTLNYELHKNNYVYLSLANQNNIEFGIFDIHNQRLVSEQFTLPQNQNLINKLYIGGFLNNNNPSYTGFSGQIYHSILTNKPLVFSGIQQSCMCLLATGQTSGSGIITGLIIPTITGYLFSGFQESIITGYTSFTGIVTKSDGTTVRVIFPSGLTGLSQTQEIATILTGTTVVSITGSPIISFINDTRINNYTKYNIEFDLGLQSGDTLEIYTFPSFNPSVNFKLNSLEFPVSKNFTQLMGNGLVETNGVDYGIDRGLITGFTSDDILLADFLTGQSLVSPFSGWWARSKIPMSGGVFFPPAAQFEETVDTGRILITGLSGQRFSPNYDFFINGQKLISGVHYLLIDASVSGWFGGTTGLTVAVINPNLTPDFIATPLYSPTGGLPTGIYTVEDSEITALPNFGNFSRFYLDVTSNLQVYSGVTGFSEQVWVNGIRQTYFIDYLRNYDCTVSSGFNDFPDLTFKSLDTLVDTGYWNS